MRNFIPLFALLLSSAAAAQDGALLVTSKQTQSLVIVDGRSLAVTARIPVGENPHEVVVGPDGKTAYVSNFEEGVGHELAVVDLASATARASLEVSPLVGPHGMAFQGGKLWFTADRSQALAALDPATGKLLEIVGTGQERTHMLWIAADGARMLATNAGSGTASFYEKVETGGWKHRVLPTGPAAEGFAVSPDGKQAWVGAADGTIAVIDLAAGSVAASFQSGTKGDNRLAFTTDGKLLLVTQRADPDLVAIDVASRRIVKKIPIQEHGASGILIEPNGNRVFVACPRDHYVAVVDLHKLEMIGKVDVGREPDGLAWWVR